MLGKLNETQISNILTGQVIGRLACTDGKQPYIVPLTYTYNGKYIYGQTNEGMKLDILRKIRWYVLR
ncbi:MAG: pyridoxamine 5'-phosphate oxidase family protein [Chitinophagaceae bacterium]|nr:pyridoxamine 5'-phosphate oxidase family protein [Chitinophagaceae bacterium]